MTGHAFQQLVEDDEIRAALAAIRAAVVAGGRLAFETRNPLDRAWERWPTDDSGETTDATGAVVRCDYRVEPPVKGGVVRSTSTLTSPAWDRPEVSRGALRILGPETLSTFVSEARLTIEERFDDWTRQPLTATSPEITTIARKP